MKRVLVPACLFGAAAIVVQLVLACGSDEPDQPAAAADGGGTIKAPGGDGGGSSSSQDGQALLDGASPRVPDEAGVTADGGVDPADAGPGGDTTQIACGTTTCPIPAETCCVSEVPGDPQRSFACVAGSTCPTPAGGGDTTGLKCSSSANCAAGTVCCVNDNNGAVTSTCKASCGNNEAQLCDLAAGDAGGCPSSDPCSNNDIGDWGLPRNYATCGGQGN